MHPLAEESNANLPERIRALLSKKGREIFFPSKGILGQSAEAKGKRINATIGIALEDDGSPMRLPGLAEQVDVAPADVFPYAPSYGKPGLRDLWRSMLREKNPSLGDTAISRPVVTHALTHALSVAGYLFVDPEDAILMPDLYWGNYRLVFSQGHQAKIETYPTFVDGGYNVAGLAEALNTGEGTKRLVVLNFPNNPTGYTCTPDEAHAIRDALVAAAEAGKNIVVMIDDAYFGLVYEDGIYKESVFSLLADAHPGILAVKVDGATKEDYAWGLRVGFLTYGFKGATPEAFKALEDKSAGAVRGNISNSSHLSQSLLLKTYEASEFQNWKAEKYETMAKRYQEVLAQFKAHPEYAEVVEPLPFNSGYFMCVRPLHVDAEAVRQRLLEEYDTGLIATSGLLRVAFSSAPTDLLAELFANINSACRDVAASD
ncbi:MAG: aminotransferase class I/II-fold pyridoxal phosphate-dependent enzyme [Myxococcota bacterium]|nr:aminotransferase class I/II-fold pyridoxal phosphate-dependent enzyme [Myxococcota bacterium]